MSFLQMHDNFKPKDFDRVESFVNQYPQAIPLAVEMRNTEWFTDKTAAENFYHLLESKGRTNIIVDTAGRRDMLHMRLTTPVAFIRYVEIGRASCRERVCTYV